MTTRVIAIGDLHSDLIAFVKTLKMCNLINTKGRNIEDLRDWERHHWVGGNTHVVQCGDTMDGKRPNVKLSDNFKKRAQEIDLTDYIIMLDKQAKLQKGRVISLLGNHELYPAYIGNGLSRGQIIGYAKLADRRDYYKRYNQQRLDYLAPGQNGAIKLANNNPLFCRIGKILFMHGSLTDELIISEQINGKVDIREVNNRVAEWLRTGNSDYQPDYLMEADDINPLFNRSFSDETPPDCSKIASQLEYFPGVEYAVVGHSVHGGINKVCKGTIIRTDVALSRAFGGTLETNVNKYQALEIIQRPGMDPEFRVIPSGRKK